MYQNIPTKVLTNEVRCSYVNLVQPRAVQPGAEPRYSMTLLIPKTDTATVADIKAAIEAAAQKGITGVWNGVRPNIAELLHDGDGVKPNSGVPYGPECKGHWVLNAASGQRPEVVGMDNINVGLAPQDIYSGMYARVTLNFYPYKKGNVGVGCGLGNVMKTRDGEPLGGGASAAADFAGVGQAAGAVPGVTTPAVNPAASGYTASSTAPRVHPVTGLPM